MVPLVIGGGCVCGGEVCVDVGVRTHVAAECIHFANGDCHRFSAHVCGYRFQHAQGTLGEYVCHQL